MRCAWLHVGRLFVSYYGFTCQWLCLYACTTWSLLCYWLFRGKAGHLTNGEVSNFLVSLFGTKYSLCEQCQCSCSVLHACMHATVWECCPGMLLMSPSKQTPSPGLSLVPVGILVATLAPGTTLPPATTLCVRWWWVCGKWWWVCEVVMVCVWGGDGRVVGGEVSL